MINYPCETRDRPMKNESRAGNLCLKAWSPHAVVLGGGPAAR